jgi:hypothetical protein
MKVSLASPVGDRLEPEFVISLLATLDLLVTRGFSVDWGYTGAAAVLHYARNLICQEQFAAGVDVGVQLDVDHTWSAEDFAAAVECVAGGKADLVGFPYTTRRAEAVEADGAFISPSFLGPEGGPPDLPLKGFEFNGYRYIEVDSVGAGLLVYSRRLLEKMMDLTPRDGEPWLSTKMPMSDVWLFDFDKLDGSRLGEDVYFCRRWRKLGGKVYCSVDAQVGHIGKAVYGSDFTQVVARYPSLIE